MDVEGPFFASVVRSNAPVMLTEVDESSFSEMYQPVYTWLLDFLRQYKVLPTLETMRSKFPFIPDDALEDPRFYADAVRERALRVMVEDGIREKVIPHLRDAKGSSALAGAKEAVAEISQKVKQRSEGLILDDITSRASSRLVAYQLRKAAKGAVGVPTPWPTLTRCINGLQPGDAAAVLSRPGVGKTMTAVLWATCLWEQGYRVLFASMETPPEGEKPFQDTHKIIGGRCMFCYSPSVAEGEKCPAADVPRQHLTIRFDAIAARVSAWRLFKGWLTPPEEKRLERFYEKCKNGEWSRGSLRIVANPHVKNLADVELEVMQYRPDIVFWDSAYLGAKSTRIKGRDGNPYSELLIGFKLMLRRLQIPGVITWHFNRDVDEDDTTATMNSAALTDDMGRVFDVILGLFRTQEMIDAREAILRALKTRDGLELPELRSKFDLIDTIDFSEIPIVHAGDNS